ncbi:uncharacterized protein N7515_003523 [Penicillium bovifimosum]|uniref:GPI mannosyltransferase 2 n=1 Tax=Penicillium bovifimosum TaxID=126998 RepID=A0A9W9L6A3_9EURO|nr:uncharacterized protein N7515_003523 [Penicillium bovifimosum]KAJ5138675.1 hypothetical protein N7515_003523 [Penicillium bovifimosum]
MTSIQPTSRPPPLFAKLLRLDNPIRSLTLAFWTWKILLYIVVTACPGLGYDTSTSLISYAANPTTVASESESLSGSLKFARWDSIYFLNIAQKGYLFEQEWAFGWGYTKLLSLFVSGIRLSGGNDGPASTAMVGVVLSHVAHYLSVLALYRLSSNIFGHATAHQHLICFLSAALHIISPAGAFLSAPYGESIVSFLNITGFYLYSSSLIAERNGATRLRDVRVLTSAVLFAVATMVRSNGVLSGFLFAYDATVLGWKTLTRGPTLHTSVRLAVIVFGGCIVGSGMVIPQILAYRMYCMSEGDARPWCKWALPSIYGWVQEHYWNVGFLRYWTVSNIPLFLLAAPMLAIICRSSLWALQSPSSSSTSPGSMLTRLAVPQGLLAVMAFVGYHVQIINRISSGYPLWYWYLVTSAVDLSSSSLKQSRTLAVAVYSMVGYALIQGVLFGSFLPPA